MSFILKVQGSCIFKGQNYQIIFWRRDVLSHVVEDTVYKSVSVVFMHVSEKHFKENWPHQ